ncbi:MAG: RsiV family protein [Armatimonadota bacterium]
MTKSHLTIAACICTLFMTASAMALTLKDVKPNYWKAVASVPAPKGSSPLERFAYTQMSRDTQALYNQWMGDTKTELSKQPPRHPFDLSITTTYGICNDRLVSGLCMMTSEFGGAHPTASLKAYSYGLVKGQPKRLILRDLLSAGVTPDTVVTELVLPALNQQKAVRGGEAVSELNVSQINNILITKSGITWIFGPYEVGPWAEGDYAVKIPWSKLKGYLNPKGPVGVLLK